MLASQYDFRLVALSILIAIGAVYAALTVAERIATGRRRRRAWIAMGALVMGFAVWSMHYVGMLAFLLPVPVRYDVPLVFWSVVAAVVASAIALTITARPTLSRAELGSGALCMGAGIAGMHYTGMAAMKGSCTCVYSPPLVVLSIVIAIVVSGVALAAFRLPSKLGLAHRLGAAVLLGGAICSMHYTGMAAAHFFPSPPPPDDPNSVSVSWLGAVAIGGVSLSLLGFSLAGASAERFFAAQAIKLESTEERYRQLFEKSLAGICRATADGVLLDCNHAFIDLLGFSRKDQVIGLSLPTQVLTTDSLQNFLNRVLTNGSVASCETQVYRADGALIWVLVAGTLIQTAEAPAEIQGMFLDIQELKRKELELQKARIQSEKANQAKTQFLANMSHELRTPLVGVLGMADIMESGDPNDLQRKQLGMIRDSADSLLSMISKILDFTERGHHIVSSETFFVSDLVMEEIRLLQVRNSPRGEAIASSTEGQIRLRQNLNLRFESRIKERRRYCADSTKLRGALRALLDNAVKFTPAGEIVVTLSSGGRSERAEFLSISVRDTGVGIDKSLYEAIFEPFNQADTSNSRSFGGTGIGLAIAREGIRSLGGDIALVSAPGVGSTFSIEVALTLQEANEASGNLDRSLEQAHK